VREKFLFFGKEKVVMDGESGGFCTSPKSHFLFSSFSNAFQMERTKLSPSLSLSLFTFFFTFVPLLKLFLEKWRRLFLVLTFFVCLFTLFSLFPPQRLGELSNSHSISSQSTFKRTSSNSYITFSKLHRKSKESCIRTSNSGRCWPWHKRSVQEENGHQSVCPSSSPFVVGRPLILLPRLGPFSKLLTSRDSSGSG